MQVVNGTTLSQAIQIRDIYNDYILKFDAPRISLCQNNIDVARVYALFKFSNISQDIRDWFIKHADFSQFMTYGTETTWSTPWIISHGITVSRCEGKKNSLEKVLIPLSDNNINIKFEELGHMSSHQKADLLEDIYRNLHCLDEFFEVLNLPMLT
jgi:hypothetical protein